MCVFEIIGSKLFEVSVAERLLFLTLHDTIVHLKGERSIYFNIYFRKM